MSEARAISLFAGCGGDSLGLERAGFKVVGFSEFNMAATKTHLANFPESVHLVEPVSKSSDITKIPDSVFEPYKGVDVVFAGFPCQGFSAAGKKKANDPRNQLFRQFVRVVKVTEPAFFIGENVVGLLNMKSGPKETDPLVLTIIEEAFAEIGYSMTYKVLEAVDFGVPQKRKRLLIVGWRQASPIAPASFWAAVAAWGAAQPTVKVSSFLEASLEGAYKLDAKAVPSDFDTVATAIPDSIEVSGIPHPYVTLKASSFDTEYAGKTHDRLLSCGKRDSPIHSEVLNPANPCKTIICTYEHQPRLLVGLKNSKGSYVRCLFPDELKRIQGFPVDFGLKGTKKEQIVQVGNAVPPAIVEALAQQLAKLIA